MASLANVDLFGIISDLKTFLYAGFQTLPLTLAGTFLLISLFTGNFAMIFFLIGYLIIVPAITTGINILAGFAGLAGPVDEICNSILSYPTFDTGSTPRTQDVLFTHWMGMAIFFFSYLITNAVKLYKMPPPKVTNPSEQMKNSIRQKTSLRKSQMIVCMLMISLIALLFIMLRVQSGCDGFGGTSVAIIVFGLFGWGWFELLSVKNDARLSDIFGIANRLLSPDALVNQPMGCYPQE